MRALLHVLAVALAVALGLAQGALWLGLAIAFARAAL